MERSLGAVLFKSIGAGYSFINLLGEASHLEILEFSPLGPNAQTLVIGPESDMKNYLSKIRADDVERSLCISPFDEKILRSYLSLDNLALGSFALIIEGRFSGDLFQAAHELTRGGMGIVDFRVFRSPHSTGYLFMTGSDISLAASWMVERSLLVKGTHWETASTNLSHGNIVTDTGFPIMLGNLQVTLLSDLSPAFRQFIDLNE